MVLEAGREGSGCCYMSVMGAGAMRRNVYISRGCGVCGEQMVSDTSQAGQSSVVVSVQRSRIMPSRLSILLI
jgi:hypothetical protein